MMVDSAAGWLRPGTFRPAHVFAKRVGTDVLCASSQMRGKLFYRQGGKAVGPLLFWQRDHHPAVISRHSARQIVAGQLLALDRVGMFPFDGPLGDAQRIV